MNEPAAAAAATAKQTHTKSNQIDAIDETMCGDSAGSKWALIKRVYYACAYKTYNESQLLCVNHSD